MLVTYAIGDKESDAKFEHDFRHLFYRIKQLNNIIIYYYVRGELHGFVFSGFNAAGIPYIDRVTFDDEAARKYNEKMDAYFRQPLRKCKEIKLPKFDIEVRIAYGEGVYETRPFAYSKYGDEELLALCKGVRQKSFALYNQQATFGG